MAEVVQVDRLEYDCQIVDVSRSVGNMS